MSNFETELERLHDEIESLKSLINEKLVPRKRLLNQKEACIYLNISAGTMNYLIKTNEIHPVMPKSMNQKKPRPKYDIKNLDNYIERHTVKGIKSYKDQL